MIIEPGTILSQRDKEYVLLYNCVLLSIKTPTNDSLTRLYPFGYFVFRIKKRV